MPVLTCREPTDEPIDTGLVDADGNPIWRRHDRQRLGFLPALTPDPER